MDSEQSARAQDDYSCIKREMLRQSSTGMDSSSSSSSNAIYRMTPSTASSAQRTLTEDEMEDRQRLIDALTDSPTVENTQPRLKRSRKQQLTSMNRDDGEIIIQPASMLSEEELNGKKRGRRRRSRLTQDRTIGHEHTPKRIKQKRRHQVRYASTISDRFYLICV